MLHALYLLTLAILSPRRRGFNSGLVIVGFYGVQIVGGRGFSTGILVFSCRCHSTNAPYSYIIYLFLRDVTLAADLLIYLLTYLLPVCSTVLLEKLTGFQLVKKFPTFYGTRRFITAVTSARHLSLS